MMADCSPLLLELTPTIRVFLSPSPCTSSRPASHRRRRSIKDNHLRGQARFCPHKRLNNAFMLHASTSPFYPLFAALDVNAKIHEGESGRRLWAECVALGIEARKAIIANCKMIQPFIPPTVAGASRGRITRPRRSPGSAASSASNPTRAGMVLKATRTTSILSTRASCC